MLEILTTYIEMIERNAGVREGFEQRVSQCEKSSAHSDCTAYRPHARQRSAMLEGLP